MNTKVRRITAKAGATGLGGRIQSGAARLQSARDSAQASLDAAQARVGAAQARMGALNGAKPAAGAPRDVIFEGTSHDEGRNATVTLYSDRIERIKERSMMSLSSARQDVEVTPIRSVSSVQAKKAGIRTNVTVYASGNNIDFRFGHDEARQFREALMNLITGSAQTAPPAPAPSPEPDLMDQLKKLGELRDADILTDEEFEAKKAEMLKRL